MPPSKVRPSPIDRFTDASPSAISSGFAAAMAIGPQPKGTFSEGTDWLRSLQKASGMGQGMNISDKAAGEDEELSEGDEDDGDSEAESPIGTGKKKGTKKTRGKSKGGKAGLADENSAAQRKAQNRIAQREFRQRKQQYIRALEARVELLSSDHDTQVDRLRFALRGLLSENNQLRAILGSIASFVGSQMIGGPLQKAGVSREELESIILNSSEKTMTETWQNWPGARECEALRQIRLESNLPPEGLPESNKLPEHALANTAAAHAAAARKQAGEDGESVSSSLMSEKKGPSKRKASADDGTMSEAKRSQSTGNTNTNAKDGVHPVPSMVGSTNSASVEPANSIPRSDQSSFLAGLFDQAGSPNPFVAPGAFNYPAGLQYPFLANSLTSPSSSQPDSNAILASLFGAGGMGGYVTQQESSAPAFAPAADGTTNGNGNGNGNFQKTIPNVEEPIEIKRLNAFAANLRDGSTRFGKSKDEGEISRIVEGMSQLIQHMAAFRRQPSYQLPRLLDPSELQQRRPHDPLIDALPFASLRETLIKHQYAVDMDNVLLDLFQYTILKSGDPMEASSWEIQSDFFRDHPDLVEWNSMRQPDL